MPQKTRKIDQKSAFIAGFDVFLGNLQAAEASHP
jgi:hypothetical protein